ncbi:MFS transporter [Leucobacter ruminantium]
MATIDLSRHFAAATGHVIRLGDWNAMTDSTPVQTATGTWRELLTGRNAPIAIVLAGGVLVEASNVYLTTSLLPTIVGEIGGMELYAWTMTAFLLASIVTSMLVSRALMHWGAIGAYLIALGTFALGSFICAASPTMPVLLAGRTVQGLGGGLLAGLGYVMLQRALPERLWARGAALVSAMWGIGNILGPLVGGLFAQFGAWRLNFTCLAGAAILLSLVAMKALPRTERGRSDEVVPWVSLGLVGSGVIAIAIASVLPVGLGTVIAFAAGVVLALLFIAHEKRSTNGILPRIAFDRRSPLAAVYLTVAVFAFAIGTEAFVPLFGQEIGLMGPLVAGLLGAALSFGWSIVQVFSANVASAATQRLLIAVGPVVVCLGLAAYGALQHSGPSATVLVLWFVTLFCAGSGIGLAFPHLTVAALGSTRNEEEGAKAAAAINTVLIIAQAFSATLAGMIVNFALPDMVHAARTLMITFAIIAIVGTVFSRRASRGIEQ